MSKYIINTILINIEQSLTETMADFLDNESIKLDEAIDLIQDPVKREESELHIRMAKAAMKEYIKTMTHERDKEVH